jgi:hypothetical protein
VYETCGQDCGPGGSSSVYLLGSSGSHRRKDS